MREILFTGKLKADNGEYKKGDWVFGDLVRIKDGDHTKTYIYGFGEVIPETVGQFTGLYDSTQWEELTTDEQALFLYPELGGKRSKEEWKGKRIYSGHILKGAWDTKVVVFYDEISTSYRAKTADGFERELSYFGIDKLKVISNIHDNPELLKEV